MTAPSRPSDSRPTVRRRRRLRTARARAVRSIRRRGGPTATGWARSAASSRRQKSSVSSAIACLRGIRLGGTCGTAAAAPAADRASPAGSRPRPPGRSRRAARGSVPRPRAANAGPSPWSAVRRRAGPAPGRSARRAGRPVRRRPAPMTPRDRPGSAAARRRPRPRSLPATSAASRRRCRSDVFRRSRCTVSTGVARIASGSLTATPIRTVPTSTPSRAAPPGIRGPFRVTGPVR